MGDIVNWIQAHWKDILDIVAYIIAGASVIVKLTPTDKDDKALNWVIALLAKLSLQKNIAK